jgi:mRNA interferase HigB
MTKIIGKKHLEKLKRKSKGNLPLGNAIDALIEVIEASNWHNKLEITKARTDADCIYEDFYFFDIKAQRTLILFEFDENAATIVWCGNHDAYETTFKNNKDSVKKWLSNNGFIE